MRSRRARIATVIVVILTIGLCALIYYAGTHAQVFRVPVDAQPMQAAAPTYKVLDVVDGDTIDVDMNGVKERVRYIGMDAPETVDPNRPIGCFGKEASARNKELVQGKEVRLVKDVSERDKYGRLLRYVYVGNEFINLELVKEGYAVALTVPPDVARAGEFKEAQSAARTAALGLWAACKG